MATDTFTGTDGTNLTAHTSDTGESWTDLAEGGTLVILGNEVKGGVAGQTALYLWSLEPESESWDLEVAFDFLSPAGAALIGFCVCMNADGSDGVQIAQNEFSDTLTFVDMSASAPAASPVAWVEADQAILCERRNGTLTILRDGVEVAEIDVSGYTGNRIGLYAYSAPDPSDFFRINTIQFDDVGAVEIPVNTVAPAVAGTPSEGQTLTCSTGTWDNTPTGYEYQWQRRAV